MVFPAPALTRRLGGNAGTTWRHGLFNLTHSTLARCFPSLKRKASPGLLLCKINQLHTLV